MSVRAQDRSERIAAIPTSARVAAVMVCVVAFAVLLDAWDRPVPGAGILWLDLAASLTLGWALLAPGVEWRREAWATPFDGRVGAAIVLAVLDVLHTRGDGVRLAWLHQSLAATVCYFAFASRLRWIARGAELLWVPFGIMAFVLGVHAVLIAATGIAALGQSAALADAAWASEYGVAKALLLATLVCAGRACEPHAAPYWRIATLLGSIGCVLHGLAGGIPLQTNALTRLDEPLYFSTIAVTLLLLVPLTRGAWMLRREHRDEAGRWTGLVAGFAAVTVMAVLGETTGGEGVRVLTVLGAVAVVVGGDTRTALVVAPPVTPSMEQAAPLSSRAA